MAKSPKATAIPAPAGRLGIRFYNYMNDRTCDICKRGSLKAYNVSHSKRHTLRRQHLNLQKKTINGKPKNVCVKCLRTMVKK